MSAIALLIEITLAVNALICFREVEWSGRGTHGSLGRWGYWQGCSRVPKETRLLLIIAKTKVRESFMEHSSSQNPCLGFRGLLKAALSIDAEQTVNRHEKDGQSWEPLPPS